MMELDPNWHLRPKDWMKPEMQEAMRESAKDLNPLDPEVEAEMYELDARQSQIDSEIGRRIQVLGYRTRQW